MKIFYWAMSILIAGTLAPSLMYIALYAATGEEACARRARVLWDFSRVILGVGVNLLIWGHVLAGLWQIWSA